MPCPLSLALPLPLKYSPALPCPTLASFHSTDHTSITSDYSLLITWLHIIPYELTVHPYLPLKITVDAFPLLSCNFYWFHHHKLPPNVISYHLLFLLLLFLSFSLLLLISYSPYSPWIDRYESIIATLCENLEDLDEPEVRTYVYASVIEMVVLWSR